MNEALDQTFLRERTQHAEPYEGTQETAWVRASQQGDSLAFNRLVLKWERPIYNLAVRMLQNADDASEATQEVFLSAFRNIQRFRLDAQFSTWLYRIAANYCISRIRRRPQGIHVSLDDQEQLQSTRRELPSEESHEKELLRREMRNQVLAALDHLSAEQKLAVELKFFQELNFEEIAAIMQAPMSTVKSRFYSGLEMLKTRLGTIAAR